MNEFDWTYDIKPPLTKDNVHTGLSVMIDPKSEYYQDGLAGDPSNPTDVVGVISNIDYGLLNEMDSLSIYVKWSDTEFNFYDLEDLRVIDESLL